MVHDVFLRLSEDKKYKILEAAKTEFITHGFENAKVTRICERAELKRPTFYSYFDSLDDIYNLLYKNQASSCKEVFRGRDIIRSLTEDTYDKDMLAEFKQYFNIHFSNSVY